MKGFKIGQRVKYLGGVWEPSYFKLKIGDTYTINYVNTRASCIRLVEVPLKYSAWNYYYPEDYFGLIEINSNIKVI